MKNYEKPNITEEVIIIDDIMALSVVNTLQTDDEKDTGVSGSSIFKW